MSLNGLPIVPLRVLAGGRQTTARTRLLAGGIKVSAALTTSAIPMAAACDPWLTWNPGTATRGCAAGSENEPPCTNKRARDMEAGPACGQGTEAACAQLPSAEDSAAAAAELVIVLSNLWESLSPYAGECALSHMAHRLAALLCPMAAAQEQGARPVTVDELWDHSEALWPLWDRVAELYVTAGREATLAALPPMLRATVLPLISNRALGALAEREPFRRARKHSRSF